MSKIKRRSWVAAVLVLAAVSAVVVLRTSAQPTEPYCRTMGPGSTLTVEVQCPTTSEGTPITDLKYVSTWYQYGVDFTEQREAQIIEVTDPDGLDSEGNPLVVTFTLTMDETWEEDVEHRVIAQAGDERGNWSGFSIPGADENGVEVTFKLDATAPDMAVILRITANPSGGVRLEVE